ncbi:MAG: carboxypeptidase regulatory-like domain-containing protein [Acidobacteria bacterium]|nr:carboxypeptidase regulatory-like domain-containing protein [Acidobacteriota bacterium]
MTRLFTFVGGGRDGEIADVSLTFNGNSVTWGTDGNASRVDIAEVATHEIGHSFGLDHSPVGASTMFPRTGNGSLRNRSLSPDDQLAAATLYPSSAFASQTGILRGSVRDSAGGALFGAIVAVNDANGNVIASALSQRDGTYRIQGLPPGEYSACVQPLNPPGGLFFSRDDLNAFYSQSNTDFLTSNDSAVSIRAGSETAQNFSVTRGTPAMQTYLIHNPATHSFSNIAVAVERGQTVTIGVGGPGLPASGTPLSVSGTGVSLSNFRFGTFSGGSGTAVLADAVISSTAAPGARNLIVTANGQRTIALGAFEITGSAQPPPAPVSVVSAANFSAKVAAESIVSAFGTVLATSRVTATSAPLPTSLGGTTVRLRDNTGVMRDAPLFFVSPTQLNFQMPPGLQYGNVTITITNGSGQTSAGSLVLERIAPGLFTANGNGAGPGAAAVLRVKANGAQSYEPVVRFDAASSKLVTVPIDMSNPGDQVFLLLFGTGIRFRTALNAVSVTVGGAPQQVSFADKQGGQVGLDQINVRLSGLTQHGEVDVVAIVEGQRSNVVRVNVK